MSGPTLPPPAPGWLPDPSGAPVERYWDGATWTDSTRPATRTPSPPGVPAAPIPHEQPRRRLLIMVGAAMALLVVVGLIGALVDDDDSGSSAHRSAPAPPPAAADETVVTGGECGSVPVDTAICEELRKYLESSEAAPVRERVDDLCDVLENGGPAYEAGLGDPTLHLGVRLQCPEALSTSGLVVESPAAPAAEPLLSREKIETDLEFYGFFDDSTVSRDQVWSLTDSTCTRVGDADDKVAEIDAAAAESAASFGDGWSLQRFMMFTASASCRDLLYFFESSLARS